jgi:hypothetical protein
MTRHGSVSLRKLASHTSSLANGNLSNQITQHRSQPTDNTFAAGRAFAAIQYDRRGVPRKSDDITADLKRRARRLAVDGHVDHGTRSLIRHALETRDPYLVQLVTRVERGEMRIDRLILDND